MSPAKLSLVDEQPSARRAGVPPLGEILVARGAVDQADLDSALSIQKGTGARIGELLVAHGWAEPEAIAAALAEQYGFGHADLTAHPPDPQAYRPEDLPLYLEHRLIPWSRVGALTCYATDEPSRAAAGLAALRPGHGLGFFAVASPRALDRALTDLAGAELAARAATRTPWGQSVRSLDPQRKAAMAVFAGLLALAFVVPGTMLWALAAGLFALNLLTTGTRIAAMMASGRTMPKPRLDPGAVRLAERRPLPKISLLVPLYDEAGMIAGLLTALERLDYPRERLDVKLLLEADDHATRQAAEAAKLPPWVSILVVPDGQPRTKPRALNVALDFCDGDIVGILDAEDRPAADQLALVADHLNNAPPSTACVQCQLGWFNARENWLSRCFQIEYGIWFDVLLRGFQWLGLPVPLGGTSVYFRRRVLTEVGGWDAHNVTEDADLGMRLVRAGYGTAVLTSTTEEEANCRVLPWIRQRSRWLKGFMMTWLCHMRAPVQLWRDMGAVGFLGLNVLFLGGAVTYLAMPVFWIALFMTTFTGQSVFGDVLPGWAAWGLTGTLAFGQVVMAVAAGLAMKRRSALDLMLWVPTLPLYWTLGAAAAWKAIIEIGIAPFYWDKTRHGVTRMSEPKNSESDGDAA